MNRTFVSLGAWFALAGVALGAFGTHSLKDRLTPALMETWHTATQYHLIHAVALIAAGLVAAHSDAKLIRTAGWLFVAGILIFSGTLYAYSLTGTKAFAIATPLGGVAFMAGWGCLAVSAKR